MLKTLLKYTGANLADSQKDYGDHYISQLKNSVRHIKASREMEARYMLLQELLNDERKAALAEGLAKGRAEGRALSVLDVLKHKTGALPAELRSHILSITDEDVLSHYLEIACSSNSVDEFLRLLP